MYFLPPGRLQRVMLSAVLVLGAAAGPAAALATADEFEISEDAQEVRLADQEFRATIRKQGYVTGVAAGSLVDRKTGFHDPGFGLDIIDWVLEPGSDEAYRSQLPKNLIYEFGNAYHGKTPKRIVEGPQICTEARQLAPKVIRGKTFVAVVSTYKYQVAAPGKKVGSTWTQTLVFPAGERFFLSSDRIATVNDGDASFLRLDMPGHIKHNRGDTFSEVYLSYFDKPIPAEEFFADFAPDEKFNYTRNDEQPADRMIRACHLRDPKTGREGPWLAGMTLNADIVSEAWCHQRGYVSFIEEIGGRPTKAGESFGAAFIVGYFDSIAEMQEVYDRYAGHTGLTVDEDGWQLSQ